MKESTPDIPLEKVLFYLIEQTMRQSNRYTHWVFSEAEVDLTKDQWLILKKVNDTPTGLSPLEIARVLNKEAASMTRMLDILQRKGLIVREANPADRRSSLIFPTSAGTELYRRVLPLVEGIRKKAVEGFSQQAITELHHALEKIRKNLS